MMGRNRSGWKMLKKRPKHNLLIKDDPTYNYRKIDVSDWEPGETFIGMSVSQEMFEGEDWYMFYPWLGEDKIDQHYENGWLWLNGTLSGIDLREVRLEELEDKTTIITAKALPTQLNLVKEIPNLLVLEVVKGKGSLSGLSELRSLTRMTVWNQADDVLLSYLVNMENLRELHLYGSQVVNKMTDAGLKLVAGLSKLKGMTVGGTCSEITDTGLSYLKNLEDLRVLELSGTAITDAGLAHLKGFKNFNILSLPGARITDAGLAHIQVFTKLKNLSLRNNKITDAGIIHLLRLRSLKNLNLTGTEVTEEGISRIRKSLPDCMVISEY